MSNTKGVSACHKFFDVAFNLQTYLNVLYMIISFPLALIYFLFLIIFIPLGIALITVWVGIPLLILVIAIWSGFVLFERMLAKYLLNAHIWVDDHMNEGHGFYDYLKNHLKNMTTWKGLVFLLVKFPVSLITFIITVVLLTITIGMITAPLLYMVFPPLELSMAFTVTSIISMFLVLVIGILLGVISLHIINGMAKANTFLTEFLLSGKVSSASYVTQVRKTSVKKSSVKNSNVNKSKVKKASSKKNK